MCSSPYCVVCIAIWVRNAHQGKCFDFERLHRGGIFRRNLVVEPGKMQHSVDDQVRRVGFQRDTLLLRLALAGFASETDVAQQFGRFLQVQVDQEHQAAAHVAQADHHGPVVAEVARKFDDAHLRDAVGPNIDIMVDFHGRPASVNAALDYINVLADARVMFVEEPVPPEDVGGLAEVTRRSPVAIASGERLVGRREFEPSLRARAFNIAQPDICHTGGLWEAKKIAAIAETNGIGIAPHNPLGPIAGVAALHFGISTHNVIIQEEMSGAVPWYGEVVNWPIERRPGRWDKPTLPGLGIEVNEKVIDAHPFAPDILHARGAVLADGTVVDW